MAVWKVTQHRQGSQGKLLGSVSVVLGHASYLAYQELHECFWEGEKQVLLLSPRLTLVSV